MLFSVLWQEKLWIYIGIVVCLCLLLSYLFLNLKRKDKLKILNEEFSSSLFSYPSYRRFFVSSLLKVLGIFLFFVSLASPFSNVFFDLSKKQNEDKYHEVAFLLDVSASMDVRDSREHFRRIDDAVDVVSAVLDNLKGYSSSLFTFSSGLLPVVPMSYDYDYIRYFLSYLKGKDELEGESNLVATINDLESFWKQSPIKERTLIIISDGEDTSSLHGIDKKFTKKEIEKAAKKLDALGVRIYSVILGTSQGGLLTDSRWKGRNIISKSSKELLQVISDNCVGNLCELSQASPENMGRVISQSIKKENYLSKSFEEKNNFLYFQYPLFLGLACFFFGIFISQERSVN
jgi:hypothetical protein